MKRSASSFISSWLKDQGRKPLILRGARQVGKSTLVRLICKLEKRELIELNLEIDKLETIHRETFSLQALLDEIQLKKNQRLSVKSVIFFDEIQESPRLLTLLRYFYEQAPQYKVIAAGSLLEITLKTEDFSFPVGRVEFFHLGPMTFREFLWATNRDVLDEKLAEFEFNPETHKMATMALRDYYYVGGMPEAVAHFSETGSLIEVRRIQSQVIQTYQADFPKYNKRINLQRISRVFSSAALFCGKKVVYSKLDAESVSRDIKRVVELLIDARVLLPTYHSDGNYVPLLGEVDPRVFKVFLLDIGLLNALLRLDIESIDVEFKNCFATRGVLAEQFVAQHLAGAGELQPELIYHLRDKGTQKAEVDFLIELKSKVIPIEVKSSASGHLKSLKYFCRAKAANVGVKVSLGEFSVEENFVEQCKLVNFPLYAVDYLRDYLAQEFA